MKIFPIILAIAVLSAMVSGNSLEVTVYRLTDGGKDYSKFRLSPGETVNAFIEVSNTNTDRRDDDQEIQNIEVTLTIEDLDDGEDFEESFDDFDLLPKGTKSLPFKLQVPIDIEERDYAGRLEAEAFEGGTDIAISEPFFVSIVKKSHQLAFEKLEFSPSRIGCNQASILNTRLRNVGSSDENVAIKVSSPDFVVSTSKSVSIEAFPGRSELDASFPFKSSSQMQSGEYEVSILLNYSGVLQQERPALVVDCSGEIKEYADEDISSQEFSNLNDIAAQNQAGAAQDSEIVQQATNQPIPENAGSKDSLGTILLPLFILGIIILLLVILLIVARR